MLNHQKLVVMASLGMLAGCGSDSDDPARFSLAITDAPIDEATQVVIEFTAIELKPRNGSSVVINLASPQSIDLLTLQNGETTTLIDQHTIAAGEYDWVRLAVNAEFDNVYDSYIVFDNLQHELFVPSGAQTGLKLNQGFTVAEGQTARFVIDFDLRKSIVEPVGQPGYFLKPTLRLIDLQQVGALSGEIAEARIINLCQGEKLGAVYVYSGVDVTPDDVDGRDPEPLTSVLVYRDDDRYRYHVGFLAPGNYTAAYTCDAVNDLPESDQPLVFTTAANVSITANATTTLNFD
ncbi:DUF4382 domain-containing protein [Permianibacter aggregans]|uniref:Uncharacterized protein DUF4382 n=1 Tax=Permianibacter aggregans TaxID=1510150 RepID=A0A4R6UY39_9GAMM|nr:DUF4382 domain-containing protein [Permianibacter aggregans]QGX38708.1 DUF4382 domain-containing protein [Permianibacter aggregans]TDQ50505.1 uncharacterized protein DUF4382 [Permianibacter aggregans]